MQTLKTKIYGEMYAVKADFENPASPVFQLAWDGEWMSTQYQVAEFADAWDALHRVMVDSLSYGGDVDDDDVDSAVEKAEWI